MQLCKVTLVILHGVVSPYSGRDCVKSLGSSYTGLYPQSAGAALGGPLVDPGGMLTTETLQSHIVDTFIG